MSALKCFTSCTNRYLKLCTLPEVLNEKTVISSQKETDIVKIKKKLLKFTYRTFSHAWCVTKHNKIHCNELIGMEILMEGNNMRTHLYRVLISQRHTYLNQGLTEVAKNHFWLKQRRNKVAVRTCSMHVYEHYWSYHENRAQKQTAGLVN